jgi:hypothetical protein
LFVARFAQTIKLKFAAAPGKIKRRILVTLCAVKRQTRCKRHAPLGGVFMVDRRIFFLILAALCFLGSNSSPGWFRGLLLPLSGFVCMAVSFFFFIQARVASVAREQVYMPNEEELGALKRSREKSRVERHGK